MGEHDRGTVVLWDVDGTLVTGAGVGRCALERAFERRFGRPDALNAVRFHGNTDRAIARQALRAIGASDVEGAIDELLADYLDALGGFVDVISAYRALPGVAVAVDAVEAVGARSRVAMGLGTGNVEAAARWKLRASGLGDRFAFGGFGDDAEARAALLEAGARRGAAALGVARAACRVVVIGDTELDVGAAHAIGALAVGVATGDTDVASLRRSGAALALASFDEEGALERLLAHL